jgi:hypothetical protein
MRALLLRSASASTVRSALRRVLVAAAIFDCV